MIQLLIYKEFFPNEDYQVFSANIVTSTFQTHLIQFSSLKHGVRKLHFANESLWQAKVT